MYNEEKKCDAVDKFMESMPYIVKLSPPWNTYVKELFNILQGIPGISFDQMERIEGGYTQPIRVDDAKIYEALSAILPKVKKYGNVTLNIQLIPADGACVAPEPGYTPAEILDFFKEVFSINSLVTDVQLIHTVVGFDYYFVVCKKDVIQFFNDDTTDLYGNANLTVEDTFRDVFTGADFYKSMIVNFSTEV